MVIHQTPTMVKAVDILPLGQRSAGAYRIDNFILGGGPPTGGLIHPLRYGGNPHQAACYL